MKTWTNSDRNERGDTLLLSKQSLLWVSSVQKKKMFIWDLLWCFFSGLWLFMFLQPRNEVINCALLTLQLKLGVWGMCTHSHKQMLDIISFPSTTTTTTTVQVFFLFFFLKQLRRAAHLRHTKIRRMNKCIYGTLQPNHMQLDKTISTSTRRHTRAQAHSTFNDPILSAEWRYPQLHALN